MILHRRRFIMGLVIALARPGSTTSAQEYKAQQVGKIARIGVLAAGIPTFRQGLQELGYVEGQSIAIEYRYGLTTNAFAQSPAGTLSSNART